MESNNTSSNNIPSDYKQKKDVYICHSDKDQRYVEYLCKRFDEQGISYVYSNQKYGEKIPSELIESIHNCRIILFVATHNSYQSPFSVKELVYAFNHIDTNKIIIYQADDAKLPESIRFISLNDNIIHLDHHYVSEKLILRLCSLLDKEMKPFDETEDDESVFDSHTSLSFLLMFVYPILGIAISIGIGLWYKSILLGGSVLLATIGVYLSSLVTTVSDFSFKTPIGKLVYIFRYILCIILFIAIPICTWIGVKYNSWSDGLLWLGICWTILIALLVLVHKAESTINVSKIPLSNNKKNTSRYDLFLCYDSYDNEIVERIKTELRRNGLTYISSEETTVEEGVDCSCGFLYVGSAHCYENDRCNQELVYGFNHRRPILAYAIDQTEMPEDKKLAFSNSNIRTITTHPIETSLMGDLKDILRSVNSQHTINVDNSFWHTLSLVISSVIVVVAAVGAGIWLHSFSMALTILFGAVISFSTISDNSEQRNKITSKTTRDVMMLETLMVLSTPVLPIVAWWLFSPGPWLIILFIFLYLSIYGYIDEIIKKVGASNPVGKLLPTQVDGYYDIFISYSRRNTPDADKICELFEKEKVSYFIDRQGIPGGSEFPMVLAIAIKSCGIFLCLVSKDSFASKFCQQEIQYAGQHKPDNDTLFIFLDEETEKKFFDFVSTQGNGQDLEKIYCLNMSGEWKRQLMEQIKSRLPESQQYKMHQMQVGSHSIFRDIRRLIFDYIKKNPVSSIVMAVLAISTLLGLSFHSFIVALGVYSFLIPVPLLCVTHDFSKSFMESLQMLTFGVWLGLITYSVWFGIVGSLVIVIVEIFVKIRKTK